VPDRRAGRRRGDDGRRPGDPRRGARDGLPARAGLRRRRRGVAAGAGPRRPGEQVNSYLADAHAIEQQSKSLLEGGREIAGLPQAESLFEQHLDETRRQEERLERRLEARGSSPSRIKDIGMRLGGFNVGGFFGVQPDTPPKLVGFAYAFENLEVAGYEQLRRVAERAGDAETARLAAELADEERATAARIAGLWDAAVEAGLEAQGVA
jgi:ferritin-like metal-binding protein YciE